MSGPEAHRVQQALDAAVGGDVEPFVALLAPDLEWRGVTRGHLWWRQTASWHGPDEAREVLKHRVPGNDLKPGRHITDAHANVIATGNAGVVVALRWRMQGSDDEHSQYQALRMREGLIYDMQDYRRREQAERAVR